MKKFYLIACLYSGVHLFGHPHGAHVSHGSASIKEQGNVQEIHASDKAIINWNSFSIQNNETTRFIQPSNTSWVLNRVQHGNPSALLGTLEANGKVFLINPSGIFVGPGARIETAGFLASTLDALDSDFFKGESIAFWGDTETSIINLGTIHSTMGDVLLLAHTIDNQGSILAPLGSVHLEASREILLQTSGMKNIFIRPASSSSGSIEHTGTIEALQVEIEASGNPYTLAIKHTGHTEASHFVDHEGRILLKAHAGDIECLGSLSSPGGSIICHAENTLQGNADISVSVLEQGDAGTVLLWAGASLGYAGNVSADGGALSGNGGFIDISTPGALSFSGLASTRAPYGQMGMLLLDPSNIDIKINGGINSSMTLSLGTYTATAATGIIDTGILAGNLAGTSITINTVSGFGSPGIITVIDPVTWSAPTTLTLIADSRIQVNADVINLDATLPSSTNTFTLTAPEVFFGTGAQLTSSSIQAHSGSIAITAPLTCTLLGGNSGTSNAFISSLGTGNIDINSNTLVLNGGPGAVSQPIISATSGNINITTSNDCNVQGGSGALSSALIQTTSGSITANVSLDLNLEHPLGPNSSGSILSTSGSIDLTVGGQLNVTGGSVPGNPARIQTGSTGTITASTGTHLLVAGGTAIGSEAAIRTDSGLINLDIKGTLQITGDLSPASIETTNGGNIQISPLNDGGNTALTGGGGNNGYARIATLQGGNIQIFRRPGTHTLQGGAAGIGGDSSASIVAGLISGPGFIVFEGSDISLIGGLAPGGVNYAQIQTGPSAGNIDVKANQLLLQAGSSATQHALIEALGSGGINLFTNSLILQGSTNPLAINALARVSTASGPIFGIANTNIFLQGGIPSGSLAILNSSGTLDLTAGQNITLSGNTALSPATITASNPVLLIAGINIDMQKDSHIFASSNDVTLVVDNNFPTSPNFGPGSFIIQTESSIQAGKLRIFTAKREQNTIQSPLNGVVFVPGIEFENTNQEQWNTYYPNAFFGGPGFTLFYKNASQVNPPIPPPVPPSRHKESLSIRLFADLEVYDPFTQWKEQFYLIQDGPEPKEKHYSIKRRCHYNKCVCPPLRGEK